VSISSAPAPPAIAIQIYSQAILTKMIGRYILREESMGKAIAWAASELEGFTRE